MQRIVERTPERIALTAIIAAAAASGLVGVTLAIAGFVTGDGTLLRRSILPTAFALFAAWHSCRRQPRLIVVLIAGSLTVTAQSFVADRAAIETTTILTLFSIGFLGVFAFRRPVRWFVAAYAIFIGATGVSLRVAVAGTANAVVTGVTATVLFAVVGTVLAVTRRSLETERHRFRTLFDVSPIATFELDLSAVTQWSRTGPDDGGDDALDEMLQLIVVLRANPAAVRLLEADDVAGITGPGNSMFVSEHARRAGRAILAARIAGKERVRLPLSSTTHRGNRLEALLDVVLPPPGDEGPDMDRAILTMTDVTALTAAEERLQASLRSKDEFVATISGELRDPLLAAAGYAAELRDRLHELAPDTATDLAAAGAAASEQAAAIVQELLVAAQANLDGLETRIESVPLDELLSRIPVDTRTWTELRSPGVVVIADRTRAQQIVHNLIDNARKYGGTHIRVIAGAADGTAYLDVRDDGNPIPEPVRGVMFEPYSSGGNGAGPATSIGVGLTIARRLARLMEGDLTYHHDGAESVFRLTLPCAVPVSRS